jgi:hypothetical protein
VVEVRIVDCIQGGLEWAEARRGIATASCASRIITPSKGEFSKQADDYACQLIAEQLLPPHYWVDDDYSSRDMQVGRNTEEEARDYFAMERGIDIEQLGFCTTDDGRFGCSPDGLVGEHEGLELKCPKMKTQVRYLIDDVLPIEYAPQVHWSMIVTQRPVWNFMSYAVGLPPLIIRVERNEYTVKVAEAMERFWNLLTEMRAKIQPSDPVAAVREPQQPYW